MSEKEQRSLEVPLPGARAALVLLLAINLFNYIDRQVLAAVEPEIAKTFFKDADPETKKFEQTLMGALVPAFMVAYMVLAPVFGWLADRMSRWLLVGVGVMLWSLASGASGLAPTFLILFLTRCCVGVGEAAYGPAAPTIISDLYPVKIRGTVLAWFYAAIPVGSALGYVLGGMMLDFTSDWRWAFYVVVPPGLLLGLFCFMMREPQRGQADPLPVADTNDGKIAIASSPPSGPGQLQRDQPAKQVTVIPRQAKWEDYLVLMRTPSYVLCTLGMTAMTFAAGGIAFWMPRYISEIVKAYDLAVTNKIFGPIIAVSGLIATLLGGWAGDKLRDRYKGAYFTVSGIGMLAAFPLFLCVLWLPFPAAWVFMFLACFGLFFNTGPTNTILANVTHPSIRASAFAVNIFIIHALGDVISPLIIGAIADGYNHATNTDGGLRVGFVVVSAMILLGGVFWLWGARYLERDTQLAPARLGPSAP